jgi:hypothetical protein
MTADQLDLFDLLAESRQREVAVPGGTVPAYIARFHYPEALVPGYVPPVPAGEPAPGNTCDCEGDGDWHPYGSGGCVGSRLR